MTTVSATKLRSNLFEYLSRVSKGETITIKRNGKNIAVVVPTKKEDWRNKMKAKVKILVPADEAFAPLEEVWEDYR